MQPSDDDLELTDDDLAILEQEAPVLSGIRTFVSEAVRVPWFSRLGQPFDDQDKTLAQGYLETLGEPAAELALVTEWDEAADIAEAPGWDSPQFELEEQLRASLTYEVQENLSEAAYDLAQAYVQSSLVGPLEDAVIEAARRDGVEDEELLKAAMGAALASVHQVVLAMAADAGYDHPFLAKFALFAKGRWPIGISGMTFNMF